MPASNDQHYSHDVDSNQELAATLRRFADEIDHRWADEGAALREAARRITVVDQGLFTFAVNNLLGPTLGPHLTCNEVEAMADMMRAFRFETAAANLIDGHAHEDEPDDQHYRGA